MVLLLISNESLLYQTAILGPILSVVMKGKGHISLKNFGPIYVSKDSFKKVDIAKMVVTLVYENRIRNNLKYRRSCDGLCSLFFSNAAKFQSSIFKTRMVFQQYRLKLAFENASFDFKHRRKR